MSIAKIAFLCGGKGVRLGELGKEMPKALVEIKGKPILHHALEFYKKKYNNKFIVCIGYKGDMIKKYLGKQNGYEITYSDSGEEASMIKRIADIKKLVDDDVIIAYGDTITNIDVKKLVEFHRSHGGLATMVVSKLKLPWGIVNFSDNNKIVQFDEKPVLNYYIGPFVLNKKAFDMITKDMLQNESASDGLVEFFRLLAKKNLLYGFFFEGIKNITFNTPEEKLKVEKDMTYTLGE